MEESVNEENSDNNENVTETSQYNTEKGKATPPNITYPTMMVDCEDMTHRDINENKT